MERFLIHEAPVAGPATHALVIGVGAYSHLNGGTGRLLDTHNGMGQLSSPPISAERVARWLVEFHHSPHKPLATVALLASGAGDTTFQSPAGGTPIPVARATKENVKNAILDWKGRAVDSEDLILFFFCGHGLSAGTELALLAEDYGARADAALENAVDFRRFHLGMEACPARRQVYFIDACRTSDPTIAAAQGYAGDPVVHPSARVNRALGLRLKPVFYSTLAGEKSYARTGKPSRFTDALLKSLDGGGADDTDGEWWVDTNQLQKSMQFLMKRAEKEGYLHDQINPVDDFTTFELHHITCEPTVPVVIGCQPEALNRLAELTYTSSTLSDRRAPDPKEWDLDLPVDDYDFRAAIPGRDLISKRLFVRPPFKYVRLEGHL